jgi:hypothetical protein
MDNFFVQQISASFTAEKTFINLYGLRASVVVFPNPD